jgi:hypothetical protein
LQMVLFDLIDAAIALMVEQNINNEIRIRQSELLAEDLLNGLIHYSTIKDAETVINKLLLEYADEITENVIGDGLKRMISQLASQKYLLINWFADEIFNQANFSYIAKISLDEIRQENESLIEFLSEDLIDELIANEVTKKEIEPIVHYESIRESAKHVPFGAISKTRPKDLQLLKENLPDDLYFDLLNEYVGQIWLQSLISYSIKEVRGADEPNLCKLMPITL